MAEIDWNAPTVAPKAEIFEIYRTRRGYELSVSCDNPQGSVPFFGDGVYRWYYPDGSVRGDGIPHADDLVSIIPAPGSVEPDATQETGVVVEMIHETVRVTHHDGAAFVEIAKGPEDGEAGTFTVHDSESFVQMPPAAAIAIARAILRMAGESK
jgi:hypothetical protein